MPKPSRKTTPDSDVGPGVVEFLYQQMQIEDHWSVRTERGFEWWGWKLRQRVWADPPFEEAEPPITKISLQTDVLRSVPDDDTTYRALSVLNGIASLNAFVYDPADQSLSLRSTAYVHEVNRPWLQRLLASVCAIQAADAHSRGPAMMEIVNGLLDQSSHPSSGERSQMDDMLNILHAIAHAGKTASPFVAREFETMETRIDPAPWTVANIDGGGLTAEFPFSGDVSVVEAVASLKPLESSLLQVAGSVENPQLGSGAGLRLQLPIQFEGLDGARRANELNLAEFVGQTFCPLIGAWSGPACSFEMFLPAAVFQPGLLAAMVFSQAVRADWVRREFASTA